jgi:hypothetical protein
VWLRESVQFVVSDTWKVLEKYGTEKLSAELQISTLFLRRFVALQKIVQGRQTTTTSPG